MLLLEKNERVVKWGSENIWIWYKKPPNNQNAKYFPDFYIELNIDNKIKKFLIEIKPYRQTFLKESKNFSSLSTLTDMFKDKIMVIT